MALVVLLVTHESGVFARSAIRRGVNVIPRRLSDGKAATDARFGPSHY